MTKIRNSLKNGLRDGSKKYYSILESYFPIYILTFILYGLNTYIPKTHIFKILYSILVLILYSIVRFGILGVHYQYLSFDNTNGLGKGMFNSYKYHLSSQNVLMGLYKYVIGFIYAIIPIIITYAAIETGTILKLGIFIAILYIPTIIILFYSYGFSQLLVYHQIKQGQYHTCGILLHNCRILMQGNKIKYFILQIILMMPRLIISIIIGFISCIWIHVVALNVIVGILSYILISLIMIPYIICSQLSFYKQIL